MTTDPTARTQVPALLVLPHIARHGEDMPEVRNWRWGSEHSRPDRTTTVISLTATQEVVTDTAPDDALSD